MNNDNPTHQPGLGNGHEHEFEPEYGLPESLPADERILWQGSPDFYALARHGFHWVQLVAYFAAMLALHAVFVVSDGGSAVDALRSLLVPAALAGVALASVAALAWMSARTTVYTLTDKRVVMRVGIVLTLTFNLPLRRIESAAFRARDSAFGDIVLTLDAKDHIAWLHLWPHVRAWRLARPEPALRSVPDAARVAALLSNAWVHATGKAAATAPAAASAAAERPAPHSAPPTAPHTAPHTASGGAANVAQSATRPQQWQPSPT